MNFDWVDVKYLICILRGSKNKNNLGAVCMWYKTDSLKLDLKTSKYIEQVK